MSYENHSFIGGLKNTSISSVGIVNNKYYFICLKYIFLPTKLKSISKMVFLKPIIIVAVSLALFSGLVVGKSGQGQASKYKTVQINCIPETKPCPQVECIQVQNRVCAICTGSCDDFKIKVVDKTNFVSFSNPCTYCVTKCRGSSGKY